MSSWPCSAGPLLPETGASTNVTPGRAAASRSLKPRVASTPIVPICAHTLPSANAAATSASKMTDSTAAAVGSIVITTSCVPHRVLRRCRGDRARVGQGSGRGAVTCPRPACPGPRPPGSGPSRTP